MEKSEIKRILKLAFIDGKKINLMDPEINYYAQEVAKKEDEFLTDKHRKNKHGVIIKPFKDELEAFIDNL